MARTKTITPKQLAANRANAQRSTGPQTAEGKARAAQNSRKHGFTAAHFAVVRLEELTQLEHLRADLIASWQPANSQEFYALERLALCQYALLRASRLESGFFTACLDNALDHTGEPFRPMALELIGDLAVTVAQNRNYALADGFHRMTSNAESFTLFLRYSTLVERQYRRAIEEFERLRKLRPELPNEPISDAQPEPDQLYKPFRNEPIPPTTPEPKP